MNTGIQDAHNLAWKIGLVLSNVASTSIINTYEMERRPIAIFNTALSIDNFKSAMSIPAALGIDPAIANLVHSVLNSTFGSILHSSFQKFALEGIFSLGRLQLSPFILNEDNPIGLKRLAKLKKIFKEGKSLQLQFPAEDLGFRYLGGALVDSGNDTPSEAAVHSFRRGSRNYVASSKPGSRLPHMQIKALATITNKDSCLKKDNFSTLDLVSGDKVEFLLIIAPTKGSYNLARVSFDIADKYTLSLKVCVIWPYGSSGMVFSGSGAEFKPSRDYIDVEEVKQPCSASWWEMCHLSSDGAILVRPDEHIAWITESNIIKDPASELDRVFFTILGKRP